MMDRIYIDDEPSPEERGTNDLQQGFWFDDGLYKEWLIFLQRIWNSIEYL
ncbi:MAG: hypothetical protein ACFFED_15550 [Candidatus Thorarchaeota archaeon]